MRPRYLSQLDALRFLAIVGVVVDHNWQPKLPWIFVNLGFGEPGVQLFFVLSGFLITRILLQGRVDDEESEPRRGAFVRQFYVRRFLRIFPVYYATLAVLLVLGVGPTRSVAPWLLSYTTNVYIWHYQTWIHPLSHFWTLAVEEQFYLVWPCLLLFAPRRWLVPLLVGLIALGPSYRLFATYHYHADIWSGSYASGTPTIAVVDSLAAGALLAVVASRFDGDKVLRALARVALPLGLGGYFGLLVLDRYGNGVRADFVFSRTTQVLFACWLVGTAAYGFGGAFGGFLEWRPAAYLGKISYGIYLFHNLVPAAFAWAAPHVGISSYRDAGFANFVVSFAVTVALAALSWHLFEAPINRLKRFFPYGGRADERVAAPAVVVDG